MQSQAGVMSSAESVEGWPLPDWEVCLRRPWTPIESGLQVVGEIRRWRVLPDWSSSSRWKELIRIIQTRGINLLFAVCPPSGV